MPMTVRGISELVHTLGVLPTEVKAALRPSTLEAAQIIAEQVKANGSFSSWVAGATSVSASFSGTSGGAVVKVAERGFPHAGEMRVLEGDGVSPTPFRHPVYGGPGWAAAMTHPFLHPALEQKRDEATEIIAAAVAAVIAANGLGG